MDTGKPRPAATRRAVLVVGGAALLAAVWKDPAGHPAATAQATPAPVTPSPAGHVQADAAHPAHPAHPRPPASPAHRAHPAHPAHPAHQAHPAKTRRPGRRRRRNDPDEIMYYVHDGRKGIALTIDDGPSPEYTPQVLRLLAKHKVTATFSMIGLEVAAYPGLVREVAAAGHTIANHTWSHPDLAPLAPVTVAGQIDRAADAIHQATGRTPSLFRAPYGAWSPAVLDTCARAGLTPLDWSVDPRDWSRPGVPSIVANIMRNTRTGSIILEHDGGGNRAQTVAALKLVIPRLLDHGYHFTTP
jgi:peptidoglycan-N-acetylglucosamine deacetylase